MTKKGANPLPTDWSAGGRIPLQGRLASFQVGGVANDPNLVSAQTIQIQTDALPLEMFRWP